MSVGIVVRLLLIALCFELSCSTFAVDPVPEYLAIVAPQDKGFYSAKDFIQQSFDQLLNFFPQDHYVINRDFLEISAVFSTQGQKQGVWYFPDSWHTTVLYIGDNYSQLNTTYFEDFDLGRKVLLQSSTFVYVPGKLICAPNFPYNVSIQNPIPHITMMQGGWLAQYSNNVLQAIFGPQGPMYSFYD